MNVVTGRQMKVLEEAAIKALSVPSIVLMENAAVAVAGHCMRYLEKCGIDFPKVLVLCGKGNNGGDGFAVARHLFLNGVNVEVYHYGRVEDFTADTRTNFEIAKNIGIPIIADTCPPVKDSHLVVDAILGTGISSPVKGIYKEVIEAVNSLAKFVIAIDIPSGINADNGQVMGVAVKARQTVTLGLAKLGLYLYPGAEYAGDIISAHIGIPLKADAANGTIVLNDKEFVRLLPKREARTNKGSFGRVYVLAGCSEMPGAAVLTSAAAYKAGGGLVKACVSKHVANVLQNQLTEAVSNILPDKNGYLYKSSFKDIADPDKASVVLIGPGLGNNDDVKDFVLQAITKVQAPMVLDADALNVIANDTSVLKKLKTQGTVTPHPGEMSRLTGLPLEEILTNSIQIASNFAKKHNVVTILKDARTIIASPNGRACINTTGNCALAKAGSGDVLTGLIGAFIAQGKDPFTASILAAYLHGKAAEAASQKLSLYGVNASDVLNFIPKILRPH